MKKARPIMKKIYKCKTAQGCYKSQKMQWMKSKKIKLRINQCKLSNSNAATEREEEKNKEETETVKWRSDDDVFGDVKRRRNVGASR